MNEMKQGIQGIILEKYLPVVADMKRKYKDLPPCTLTEPEEIIAIGVVSGGEMNFSYNTTTELMDVSSRGVCGASWDGKGFKYFENPEA